MSKIVLIDYGAGNIRSVLNALSRLGHHAILTSDIKAIQTADKVIFPGVGEAAHAMNQLQKKGLDKIIPQLKQPFLGICIGQQLMCSHSEERNTDCLGIFDIMVKRFQEVPKIPHMGWNQVEGKGPLFAGIEKEFFYFVHSYRADISHETIGTCNYSEDVFSASLQKDNFFSVQFHPEKSADVGSLLLENFLKF